MNMIKRILVLVLVATAVSCVSVTPQSVTTMSDEYLCELVGPKWVSTSSERSIIYTELERRGAPLCPNEHLAGSAQSSDWAEVGDALNLLLWMGAVYYGSAPSVPIPPYGNSDTPIINPYGIGGPPGELSFGRSRSTDGSIGSLSPADNNSGSSRDDYWVSPSDASEASSYNEGADSLSRDYDNDGIPNAIDPFDNQGHIDPSRRDYDNDGIPNSIDPYDNDQARP